MSPMIDLELESYIDPDPEEPPAYPIPSAPTSCSGLPVIVERHWRFGPVDPASRERSPRGRCTAWCVQCSQLLEVQEEGTGKVIYSGFPHHGRLA